jgi:hypothetical protein
MDSTVQTTSRTERSLSWGLPRVLIRSAAKGSAWTVFMDPFKRLACQWLFSSSSGVKPQFASIHLCELRNYSAKKRPMGYFMNRGDRLVRHALQQANDSGDKGEHQPAQTEQPAGVRLLLFSVLLMAFHDKGTSERAF